MSDASTDRRIIALEERIAFQEHTLEALNRVVAEQQLEIDTLSREVDDLRGQVRAGSGAGSSPEASRTLEDDRPPHY
ncbi:MAG: SlyX family protein [Planctomycetota bacterium]